MDVAAHDAVETALNCLAGDRFATAGFAGRAGLGFVMARRCQSRGPRGAPPRRYSPQPNRTARVAAARVPGTVSFADSVTSSQPTSVTIIGSASWPSTPR